MHRLIASILFYPTLAWNLFNCRILRRWRWWDRVDNHLVVGALPFKSQVPALYDAGVRAVVNTCNEYPGPQDEYDQRGITQLRIPTVDFTPPKLEDVEKGVQFIQDHVARGESVYVHCKAGRARSVTIALCYLVATRGCSAEEAQRTLKAHRPQVLKTVYQRDVVRQFCARQGDHHDGV